MGKGSSLAKEELKEYYTISVTLEMSIIILNPQDTRWIEI